MGFRFGIPRVKWMGTVGFLVFAHAWPLTAQVSSNVVPKPGQALVVEIKGTVEVSPDAGQRWFACVTNQLLETGDFLRARENSLALIRLSNLSVTRVGPLGVCQIQRPPDTNATLFFKLWKGVAYFFSRDKPAKVRFGSPTTLAAVLGTEFNFAVGEDGRTILTMLEGEAQFTDLTSGTNIVVRTGEEGRLEPGQVLERSSARVEAINVIQWCLYYPGVLDTDELDWGAQAPSVLADSITAYRNGDLLAALTLYPPGRVPASDPEKVYYAALLLAVGQVERAAGWLDSLEGKSPTDRHALLGAALRKLVAAVKGQADLSPLNLQLSTCLLAESYYRQSRATLDPDRQALARALDLARQATERAPRFGFGWARLAELEFSFGRTRSAEKCLERSLGLSPRNAQALALKGFLLAAKNRIGAARGYFEQAIALDSGLGTAWLGRGLCKIRRGDVLGGRDDLQVAVALEPQRALFRSYLGKAFSQAKDDARALHELDLAKRFDTNDPTPWLYSALVNRQENRINTAIKELERSVSLNDNRALYRSDLLLDQDRAVRSSSLANIYQSAGMVDVSVSEAARAVSYDYANYSAHLFLADSYNALRDPTRFNLRYETVWFNELLLANLLSPVGGTPLSQNISQQEYSRLFDQNRIGLATDTSYRSDGQYREIASQYGLAGNTAWSIDLDYQHNNGVRPNNELDRLEVQATFKQQLTWRDSILLLTRFQDYHSGDNFQYYDPSMARANFYYDEHQVPGALVAGYHHEWAPGVHTLLLGGRLANDQELGDVNRTNYLVIRDGNAILDLGGGSFDLRYRSEFETYSGELSQIFQRGPHTLILGGRYQNGTFNTRDEVQLNSSMAPYSNLFPNPPAGSPVEAEFERLSGYAYWTWEVLPNLRLTPGVAYDWVQYPENHRHPPIAPGEKETHQVSPKAALVWNPVPQAAVRAAYTRSLGGVSYDESYRLEPTQLAGFSQAFRTLMPESFVGSVSAPLFDTVGVGLDFNFKTRTYLTLQGEFLESEVDRTVGTFESAPFPLFFTPSSLAENLEYREGSFSATLNQLVSDQWSFGIRYRFTRSELERELAEVPLSVLGAWQLDEGDLHQASLFALFNHPSGWFAGTDLSWYVQNSFFRTNTTSGSHVTTPIPDEAFPQLNVLAGYRLRRQRGEIALGGLNLTGEDYHLNPINPYVELPRERVFCARLRLRF